MKEIIEELYLVAGELDRLGLLKTASVLDKISYELSGLYAPDHGLEATAARRKVPKKYVAGLSSDKAEKRKTEIRRRSKEPHTDPKSYRPFATDVDKRTGKPIETEESQYTKEYRKKFGPAESDAKDSVALTKSLKKKSEDSGISVGILRQVYNRGLAAWRTGHRPGASQHAWGMARVNSFILKGKTWSTADADLAKKVRAKKANK